MLFQRKPLDRSITDRIERLQVEALQNDLPGEASIPLNQAGDLLLRAGDMVGALEMYGRAVDSLVEADRFEAATGLCRKIIRTAPDVVRARCTLAWLAIGAGFNAEVEARVRDYIIAAESVGRHSIAARHVRRMDEALSAHELRLMLGEYLLLLGDDRGADEVFGAVFRERNGGAPREVDTDQRWQDVRRAALMRNG